MKHTPVGEPRSTGGSHRRRPRAESLADDVARSQADPPPRRRMMAADRQKLILDHATRYFAEFGLSAGTIELARQIGITQPLLYKYFPTKDALLVKVYERLFPQNWDPALEALLENHTIPVRDRLTTFYQTFVDTVLTYEHVRLFLFSGLTNSVLNTRYYTVLTERIFTRIVNALRSEYLGRSSRKPISAEEMELVQSLHATVYHVAFRRWLHGLSVDTDLHGLVARKVDIYLDGAASSIVAVHGKRPRAGTTRAAP